MCGANKLNFIGLLTQLCFLFQTNLIISCQNEYEVVNTKLGPVKGIKTKFNDKSVSQFFGIPYAVPPLEELRFARPIRLTTPWKDVKDVTKPKAACMQKPHPSLNVNKDVTPLNSLKQAKLMARDLDCEEEWLKCLKKVETLKILNWVIKNKSFYPLYTNSTDGFLPLNSSFPKAFESGNFKKDVELLIGTVANEGSAYLKNEIPLYFNRENQRLIDKPLAKKLVSEMFNYSNIESDLIADFYISHIYHEERNELRKGVAYAFGDFRIVCPVYYFSKNVAHYSQISRVFSFQFTFKPTIGLAKNCVDWMGVCHADDIVFTFGVPLRHPQNYSVEDYYFSLLIINVWTSFVKTGNPAPSHYYGISPFQSKHIEWPQFRLKKDIAPNYMILHPKHFGNVIYYPYHNNCEGLWGKYFL
ncbi:acetylcholinesterase-like protein 5 [Dinothrombium tinctorium]|uniref:Acetylcholinesterase-like protein 5 n=1 Tax=Dinothrombium tinctorium TaxID=1965070 RepID=A0A443R9H7_9ACAR|nr:acetylcholinesterase-like protein 5 [Dinothrombium tinctorium]RWS11919.1 acetylcholinesterase-like protein 5 [Dinothrombium tinctorium]